MTNRLSYTVKPGGLSASDHERIHELAARGWKSSRIAREIEKHPATVQWFMYRSGLKAPEYRNGEPYVRNGRTVTPFSPREDEFIESLRADGIGHREIAKRVNAMFATERSCHTIQCRLIMLAAREVA
ncbi:MAG: hypothetical protein EOS11_28730 [Mesorhizobium sp.]|nr:MAG: hypothetical protein EOS11_28730 [Mesorhizobium sp.]